MRERERQIFYQEAAKQLLTMTKDYTVSFNEDVNVAAAETADAILLTHTVLSNENYKNVLVRQAVITPTDFRQVIEALTDFNIEEEAEELFIPINNGTHATHAYVTKTPDGKFIFEYSDPYGNKSPYGNPPTGLKRVLEEKFGKDIIFKSIPTTQQTTSSNCFAINYQNMLDKLEKKSTPTIKPSSNDQEDPHIKTVRIQMKKNLGWLYDQYNSIKKSTEDYVRKEFKDMVEERDRIYQKLTQPRYDEEGDPIIETYDPEDYGHSKLAEAEIDHCSKLLSKIDFSAAPSIIDQDVHKFPEDLMKKIQNQGHKVEEVYNLAGNKIIGYSIIIDENIPLDKRSEIADQIDKLLPDNIKNGVIYLIEKSGIENKEMQQPNMQTQMKLK